MFKQTIRNLERVKIGTKFEIKFPYDNVERIVSVESSCDCSTPIIEEENHRVIIQYTPKAVPVHMKLENRSSYTFRKTFPVYYIPSGETEPKLTILEIQGIAYE
jgi:hypothetical protein